MCRTTFHSDRINLVRIYSDSCSDSDKAMATEDVLRLPYSHCPLKKRPVFVCQDINEHQDSEDPVCEGPENLSTKPEDLRLKRKALTSPSTVIVASSKVSFEEDDVKKKTSAKLLRRYLQSCPLPLSHQAFESRTLEQSPEPIHVGNPLSCSYSDFLTPSHSSTAQYPHYVCQYLPPTVSLGDCQTSRSNPEIPYNSFEVKFSQPYRQNALYFPNNVVANLPVDYKTLPFYPTYHSLGMSTPSPPLTPEDLSSPGSVASSGCCSTGSTGYRELSKETNHKKRYQCPLCSKHYSNNSGLTKHQRSHCSVNSSPPTKKSFGCKHCEKVYVSLGALKMHIRTHTLPCKCVICGKAFSRPWLLQGHIRTHTGEKPFSCPLCNRAFADRSNLRAHLQTHSEVKKYSCSNCDRSFSRMSLVLKHREGGCPVLPSEPTPSQS